MFFKKLSNYITSPKKCANYIAYRLLHTNYGRKMDDEKYLKKMFKISLGYELDLENPVTYNEKLQWLKLYNRNPEYTIMVDKYLSKKYVQDRIGEEYVVPLYGVWDSFEEIDFEKLPDKFVLKTTHDCGGVVVCKEKNTFDKEAAKTFLEEHLKRDYFYHCREWPYKNVKPRIIAEKYLDIPTGLTEYKLFSFDGRAEVVLVCKGIAHTDSRTNTFFDRDFNKLPMQSLLPNEKGEEQKPAEYEQLLALADKLSEGIPQVRVDFYILDGQIYVGEMTFFHNSGLCEINPPEWDRKMGEWIKLPDKKTISE